MYFFLLRSYNNIVYDSSNMSSGIGGIVIFFKFNILFIAIKFAYEAGSYILSILLCKSPDIMLIFLLP